MGQKDPVNTAYTKAKGDKIIELLEQGKFKNHAAAMVGITVRTLYNWIEYSEQGKHDDWPGFQGFHIRVEEANAKYCEKLEKEILEKAGAGKNPDWRGAAFILERKFPTLYGDKPTQVELSGKLNISIPDIIAAIDADIEAHPDDGSDQT